MARRQGFTMIELLVAMVVLAISAVYLLETFTVNHRSYTVLDQTVESQQNLRAIADLLKRDVLHAGMMIPEAAGVCGFDATANPDVLYVSDHEAVEPGNDMVAYTGSRILAGAVTGTSVALTLNSLILEPSPPSRPAYDTDGDGTNDSDFQRGGGVIVADREQPGRGVACGSVTAVNVGTTTITVDYTSGGLGGAVGPVELVAIPAIEYRVNNQAVLLRNDVPLASGVEDLQIAYFFDTNGDNIILGGEARGVSGANYTASAQSVEDLRELRINFVARTRSEDPDFPTGQFIATENRTAIVGADGFRRRVHTSTVMPRNLLNRMVGI
jgi:prepilin-type N-terminal cleavage/methylation domain-containing protein